MEFIAQINTLHQAATQAQLERYYTGFEEIKNVDRDIFLLEPYAGYVDKDFCDVLEHIFLSSFINSFLTEL